MKNCLKSFASAGVLLGFMVFIVASITGCSEGRDMEPLLKQMDAPKKSVRESAVDQLIRVGSDALPRVREIFKNAPNSEKGVRQVKSAVDILVATRTQKSLETLADRLDDPNKEIRLAVVKGIAELGRVRRKLGVKLLKQAIEDSYGPVVQEAAKGLGRMNYPNANRVLENYFQKKEGLASVYAASNLYEINQEDDEAKYLLEMAGSSQTKISDAATSAATKLGVNRSVGRSFVQYAVSYATKNPDDKQLDVVLADIRDSYFSQLEKTLPPQRIRNIINILGTIGDEKSVDELLELLGNSDRAVASRIAAAEALGDAARAKGSGALRQKIIDSLLRILEEDIDSRIAIAASISLSRLRQEKGVTFLLDELQDLEAEREQNEDGTFKKEPEDITELRVRAQEALTSSGDFVVPYLLEELNEGNPGRILAWAAIYTLGDLRVDEAAPHMADMLVATKTAEEVMAEQGDPEIVTEVTTKSGKVEIETNRKAVLQEIFGDRKVIPAWALSVRMAAARGLGRVGGEKAEKALQQGAKIHERINEEIAEFVRVRGYVDMLPSDITVEAEKRKARDRLETVAKKVGQEAEKVLFYIRQARK